METLRVTGNLREGLTIFLHHSGYYGLTEAGPEFLQTIDAIGIRKVPYVDYTMH
jgi:hypothetical protein